jgi:hypothetical protein
MSKNLLFLFNELAFCDLINFRSFFNSSLSGGQHEEASSLILFFLILMAFHHSKRKKKKRKIFSADELSSFNTINIYLKDGNSIANKIHSF